MASQLSIRERLEARVRELLLEEVAAGEMTIDQIEDGMVELGDMLAREFAKLMLERQVERRPERPPCPHCQEPGEPAGERSREILTRRGPVQFREAKYRCRKCRRHFFPSGCAVGVGGEL
jgi:hypothetical protein